AAANFCKFSVEGAKNHDHAGDREKVPVSLPYVRADLDALRPQHVILPRTIWREGYVQDGLRPAFRGRGPLALPQFNRTVVNIHLMKHAARVREIEQELSGTVLPSWITQMKGYATGGPYRFLAEMDEVLKTAAA